MSGLGFRVGLGTNEKRGSQALGRCKPRSSRIPSGDRKAVRPAALRAYHVDERASVQVGGPYMDDGSGAVPCGSCGGAGRWVEPRRVTAGDVVTLEAAIASAWEAVAS